MPTAAKLVAACALALAAFGVSGVAIYRIDILQHTGVNPAWIAFVAALVGWAHLGPIAPIGYQRAVTGGVAAAFLAFAAIVLCATTLHVLNATTYHAYQDVDALLDGFVLKAMQLSLHIVDGPVLAATIAGGALAGVFSGFAGRLWT